MAYPIPYNLRRLRNESLAAITADAPNFLGVAPRFGTWLAEVLAADAARRRQQDSRLDAAPLTIDIDDYTPGELGDAVHALLCLLISAKADDARDFLHDLCVPIVVACNLHLHRLELNELRAATAEPTPGAV